MLTSDHIEHRGIRDPEVLRAIRTVPRHEFVPRNLRSEAYDDRPLDIGYGATISQPYIVAAMTQLARSPKIETESWRSAQGRVIRPRFSPNWPVRFIRSRRLPSWRASAARNADRLGYRNIHVRNGDGYRGWPEEAPFDRVILTAAPLEMPAELIDELAPEGRLVAPVGA